MEISGKTRKILLTMQKGEITEYFIYQKIASFVKEIGRASCRERV